MDGTPSPRALPLLLFPNKKRVLDMESNEQMAAIIGGCVAGGVVLIAIIAVILYTCGCCRKKRHRRDLGKYPKLTPSPDSSHSQQSSISHVGDPRLPKVSSNGLWLDARSVYAAGPSPAYGYSRPASYRPVEYPYHHGVHRASSEAGLQNVPGVHGPVGYQGRMIYHSQQHLAPVYEMVNNRTGLMDVYQYDLSHSRSRLIDQRGSLDHRERHRSKEREGKKVKRSQSDRVPDPQRPRQKKRDNSRHSQERRDKYEGARQKSKSSDSLRQAAAYDNRAFQDTPPASVKVETTLMPPSATDSMKLQAKESKNERPPPNVTDDQKRVVSPAPIPVEIRYDNEQPLSKERFSAHGVPILPPKVALKPPGYENPIVARMEEMVKEKAGDTPRNSNHGRSSPGANPPSPTVPESADRTRQQGSYPPPAPPLPPLPPSQPEPALVMAATPLKVNPEAHGKLDVSGDDTDGGSMDLGVAGKHITTAAFKFLDNYLSDDEGGDFGVESPPLSPKLQTRKEGLEY